MRNETRLLFNAYMAQIAELNGVDDVSVKFTVDPSVEQTLFERMQESSAFLGMINMFGVPELIGEKIGLGVTGTIAGRTNTDTTDRPTQDPTGLTGFDYLLAQTNFDTHLKYSRIDAWAKFPNFQTMIRDAILKRQALDRLLIGWNGTSIAATTDRVTNTLLQDVNKGWLHHMRTDNAARVMDEVVAASGVINVGEGGDYVTLDALVYDMTHSLLPTWARRDTELVAIVGGDLLHDKYFPLINDDKDPSEQLARDIIMSTKRLGGLQAVEVYGFPGDAVMVTRLDNLSIYYQEGKLRRAIIDNPKRDRIENYESTNEGYVIEDFDYACMAENVTVLQPDN